MITIQRPNTKNEFLRFQVGVMEKRNAKVPITEKLKVVGYRDADWQVEVFHLLGFSSDLDRAERMAATNAALLGISTHTTAAAK